MNEEILYRTASELIAAREYQQVEGMLREACEVARRENDIEAHGRFLFLLAVVLFERDPPDLVAAEQFVNEREKLIDRSDTKLATAEFLYRVGFDMPRAFKKLRETVAAARAEGADLILYSSLSLLGEVSLNLGRVQEAEAALSGIEEMVKNKRAFVAGDETAFLEIARNKGVEVDRVKRLAAALVPTCSDEHFRSRLAALASD